MHNTSNLEQLLDGASSSTDLNARVRLNTCKEEYNSNVTDMHMHAWLYKSTTKRLHAGCYKRINERLMLKYSLHLENGNAIARRLPW